MKKINFCLGVVILLAGCNLFDQPSLNTESKNKFEQNQDIALQLTETEKASLNKVMTDFFAVYNRQDFDQLADFFAPSVEQYISLKNTTPKVIVADAKKFFADKTNVYYNWHTEIADYRAKYRMDNAYKSIEFKLNIVWDTVKKQEKVSHYEVQVVAEVTFDQDNKIVKYLEKEIIEPQTIKYNAQDGVKKIYEQQETEDYRIDVNYPQLTFNNKNLEARVNQRIKAQADVYVSDFKTMVSEVTDDISPEIKSGLQIDYLGLEYNDRLVSFVFSIYTEFENNLHWNLYYQAFNYNIATDSYGELADVFKSNWDYGKVLTDLCLQNAALNIKQQLKDYPELDAGALTMDEYLESCGNLNHFSEFTLDQNGIRFYFAPYVLVSWASYALSMNEMFVPYASITKYLNQDLGGPVSLISSAITKTDYYLDGQKSAEFSYIQNLKIMKWNKETGQAEKICDVGGADYVAWPRLGQIFNNRIIEVIYYTVPEPYEIRKYYDLIKKQFILSDQNIPVAVYLDNNKFYYLQPGETTFTINFYYCQDEMGCPALFTSLKALDLETQQTEDIYQAKYGTLELKKAGPDKIVLQESMFDKNINLDWSSTEAQRLAVFLGNKEVRIDLK